MRNSRAGIAAVVDRSWRRIRIVTIMGTRRTAIISGAQRWTILDRRDIHVQGQAGARCIDILLKAGTARPSTQRYRSASRFAARAAGRSASNLIDADPALVNRRFAELDCGMFGGVEVFTLQRRNTTAQATWQRNTENLSEATLLLSITARMSMPARWSMKPASVDRLRLFHAATQIFDCGLPMVELLWWNRGADRRSFSKDSWSLRAPC